MFRRVYTAIASLNPNRETRSMTFTSQRRAIVLCATVLVGSGSIALLSDTQPAYSARGESVLNYQPHLIIRAESEECAQCHEHAVNSWTESTHKITYDGLHDDDRALEIVKKMGGRSIKRSKDCVQCHYTISAKVEGGRTSTTMGVSCQRCHGAAQNWLEPHQNTNVDKAARRKAAEDKGMYPTHKIYEMAAACYQCHTVLHEKLVNAGDHNAGSEFELVAWSQGEVRHDFLPKSKEAVFREHPPLYLEKLFVMGKLVGLEWSYLGLTEVTVEGVFKSAMIERVNAARTELSNLGSAGIDALMATVPKPEDLDSAGAKAASHSIGAYAMQLSDSNFGDFDFGNAATQLPSKNEYK